MLLVKMRYVSEDKIVNTITEENLHIFILANAHKFGIKKIIWSSYRSTPDIVAKDFSDNIMKIEIELEDCGIIPHINKNQIDEITHCFYIKDTFKNMDSYYKRPKSIKFVKIHLSKKDLITFF